MTTIKSHGFRTRAELDEHLADAEDAAADGFGAAAGEEASAVRAREELTLAPRQLALLGHRVSALREEADAVLSRRGRMDEAGGHGPRGLLALAGAVTLALAAGGLLRSLAVAGRADAALRSGRR